ncbi:glycoside hydrolase [Anaerococcus sp. NML200574]|uniref:sialidase family protein n=1 Tax=Anaerococcus sp. NML200574 TaxID=2954486 RepID=UPI002237DDB2|nr:sialidase family protein [Anaerococcus sp. NML200574]MCW6678480.1 glycoside hydrolase [Anaerococcus sp. NML200574]
MKKNKLPKKMMACALSLSILVCFPNISQAAESLNDKGIEKKKVSEENINNTDNLKDELVDNDSDKKAEEMIESEDSIEKSGVDEIEQDNILLSEENIPAPVSQMNDSEKEELNYNIIKYTLDKIKLDDKLKEEYPEIYELKNNFDKISSEKSLTNEKYEELKQDIEKLASNGEHIEEKTNKQAKTEDFDMYYPTYQGSDFYRIPSLAKLKDGTIIAGADQRLSTESDWGDIDAVVRIKKPGDKDFSPAIKVVDRPEEGIDKNAPFTIDMQLTPVYTGKNAGRVYMLLDSFKSGGKYWSSQGGSGYVNIDGNDYLELKDKQGRRYTVREDGVVFNQAGEATDLKVKTTDKQPFTEIGNLYRGDEYLGNVYQDSSDLQVHQTPYLWLTYSDDSGQTWSSPKDITPQVKTDNRMKFLGSSPGRGLQLKSGRLLLPLYFGTNPGQYNNRESTTFIYSDDGENWKRSLTNPNDHDGQSSLGGLVNRQNSENQLVQLNNGTVVSFMRSPGNNPTINYAISKDDGENWNYGVGSVDFKSYSQNNLSVVKHDRDGKEYIILSNSEPGGRKNGVIKVMEVINKENKNFEFKTVAQRNINIGEYQYSSLENTNLEDTFGLLYESNQVVDGKTKMVIRYTEFNWNWLMGIDGVDVVEDEEKNIEEPREESKPEGEKDKAISVEENKAKDKKEEDVKLPEIKVEETKEDEANSVKESEEEKTKENKEEKISEEKSNKESKEENALGKYMKKSSNPKTGIGSLNYLFGLSAASLAGLFASIKNKKK